MSFRLIRNLITYVSDKTPLNAKTGELWYCPYLKTILLYDNEENKNQWLNLWTVLEDDITPPIIIDPPTTTKQTGVFAGGVMISSGSPSSSKIQSITINSSGVAEDFGSLTIERGGLGGCSNGSSDIGIFTGGQSKYPIDTILCSENDTDYVNLPEAILASIDAITISTKSNASAFGNLTKARSYVSSISNGTFSDGLTAGGYSMATRFNTRLFYDTIDHFKISSPFTGTVTATNWSVLTVKKNGVAGCSNGKNNIGIFTGGNTNYTDSRYTATTRLSSIEQFVTIDTGCQAVTFGDMLYTRENHVCVSNDTSNRALIAGGTVEKNLKRTFEYIEINNKSNSMDFGSICDYTFSCACSNGVKNKAILTGSSDIDKMEYIFLNNLNSTASSFGSLGTGRKHHFAGISNSAQ